MLVVVLFVRRVVRAPGGERVFRRDVANSRARVTSVTRAGVLTTVPFFCRVFFPLCVFVTRVGLRSFGGLDLDVRVRFGLKLNRWVRLFVFVIYLPTVGYAFR